MDKYLKMADVFDEIVHAKCEHKGVGNAIFEECGAILGDFVTLSHAEYAAHAINSHDELVENMQHHKQEAEQWELRATKEASRAQDLEVEVERLRGENEALMKCRMAAREFFNCTVASGGSVKVSSANKAALDDADKASDWLEIELKATADLVKK